MHYVLFGLHLDDLVPIGRNFRGDILYNSDRLVKTSWSETKYEQNPGTPYGYAVIGSVSFDSCNYVARYCVKKQHGTGDNVYQQLGIDPEFCLMSRRPGIGREYFENNYEVIYDTDEIILPSADGSFTTKPPPYFDSLLERFDPGRLDEIKSARRNRADDAARTDAYRNPGIDLEDIYSAKNRKYENKAIFKKKKGEFK